MDTKDNTEEQITKKRKRTKFKQITFFDKTELYPLLQNMYGHARELTKNMSKNDQNNTGRDLYNAVIEAHSHFAFSFYHTIADDIKLQEAYCLLECLERIKFLTDICFRLQMIQLDDKHVRGLRTKIYITIADIQNQCDK